MSSGVPEVEGTARPRRGPGPVLTVALGLSVVVAGVFAYLGYRQHHQQTQLIRVTGIPSTVSTPLANLMALSPVPAKPAPNFTLTDQSGRPLSFASFRGRTVVLEFMDPHCVDICPIVSQEFVDAYHDLGSGASKVAFLAVNVNVDHVQVADVAAFSQEHGLATIPSWHFFTGPASDLQTVWSNYGVEVQNSGPTADVVHSSFVFFIGPDGHERYLANPTDEHTSTGAAYLPAGQLASWGQGIAQVARSLSA
jgi:cytochrome oxidase Cu insertion factor (SCO1/SenC/PrrC family)